MSMTKLVAILEARAEKVISEMDTEMEAVKEEGWLRGVPEIASLPNATIRGHAVVIARAKKQGENEMLRFVLAAIRKLEDGD